LHCLYIAFSLLFSFIFEKFGLTTVDVKDVKPYLFSWSKVTTFWNRRNDDCIDCNDDDDVKDSLL